LQGNKKPPIRVNRRGQYCFIGGGSTARDIPDSVENEDYDIHNNGGDQSGGRYGDGIRNRYKYDHDHLRKHELDDFGARG
jgi:hypothetical protein